MHPNHRIFKVNHKNGEFSYILKTKGGYLAVFIEEGVFIEPQPDKIDSVEEIDFDMLGNVTTI